MKTLVDAFEHILSQELYVGDIPIDSFRTYLKIKDGLIGNNMLVIMYNCSAGLVGPKSWPEFSVTNYKEKEKPFDLEETSKFFGRDFIGYRINGVDTLIRTPNCVPFRFGHEFKVMYPELLQQ